MKCCTIMTVMKSNVTATYQNIITTSLSSLIYIVITKYKHVHHVIDASMCDCWWWHLLPVIMKTFRMSTVRILPTFT